MRWRTILPFDFNLRRFYFLKPLVRIYNLFKLNTN
jgi:hypothetical protein